MIPPPDIPRERDKNGHLKAGIRLPGWDYCKPWIYMITLTVKERRPILGKIRDGKMVNSPLGNAVALAWKNLGSVFPEVEPCQWAVMPEHFHGIIWVHKTLRSPLGEVIRSFKIACTKANAALAEPALFRGSPTFWFPGLYDTILFSKGQLKRMTRYVLRNAERRWADIEQKTDDALLFAQRGGVVVSGCISPGEQAVARAIREAGLPLIAVIPRGFGPYFKPSGAYFDACASGNLLMLSPFPQISKTARLTRERCFGISTVAAAICGEDPESIRYRGSQPSQLV